jgi:sulfatase modifying factor 1
MRATKTLRAATCALFCLFGIPLAPQESVPLTSPAMIYVEGGSFEMGMKDDESYVAEEPIHTVELDSFFLGVWEVTVEQFRAFAEETGYMTQAELGAGAWILSGKVFVLDPAASWRAPGFVQTENEPVLCVSWNDAVAYCNALSAAQGFDPAYEDSTGSWSRVPGSDGYRLPSEAEWEYAAYGGKLRSAARYPGKGSASLLGWELENSGGRSHPVGLKPANALGFTDLCGNAWEWCDDNFGQRYYEESPRKNPGGPEWSMTKSARGGSWASRPRNCRITQRYAREPDQAYSYLGFRVARPVPRNGE